MKRNLPLLDVFCGSLDFIPGPPIVPGPHFEHRWMHAVMKYNRGCRLFAILTYWTWCVPVRTFAGCCLKWFYHRSSCLNTINDEGRRWLQLSGSLSVSQAKWLNVEFLINARTQFPFLLQINPNCSFITGIKYFTIQHLQSFPGSSLMYSIKFTFIKQNNLNLKRSTY